MKSGREVDFIMQLPNRQKILVQVCESIANEQTRKREVLALSEAMIELGLNSGISVAQHDEEKCRVRK